MLAHNAAVATSPCVQADAAREDSSLRWLPLAAATVRAAARLQAPPARGFDLFPAWFAALDLIASDRWEPTYSAGMQSVAAFVRSTSAWARMQGEGGASFSAALFDASRTVAAVAEGAGQPDAAVRLAARVVHLLAVKLSADRPVPRPGGGDPALVLGDGPQEVKTAAASLLRCAQGGSFQSFRDFFGPLQAMLGRPCSLEEWRQHVAVTLFPMVLYLRYI